MLYLLDANVLIDAGRDYYPLDRVLEFWSWLLHQALEGNVKVPKEMYDEVVSGSGDLVDWLRRYKDDLVLSEEADPATVRQVVSRGYAPDLADYELVSIGCDPFIVAYALGGKAMSPWSLRKSRDRRVSAPIAICQTYVRISTCLA